VVVSEEGISVYGKQTRFYALSKINKYNIDPAARQFIVQIQERDEGQAYWVRFRSSQYREMQDEFHGYIIGKLARLREAEETSKPVATSPSVSSFQKQPTEDDWWNSFLSQRATVPLPDA
jgi:hypothetical protein